ncbi:hypothetical protein HALLA_15355 [Halostagnicola larsenii XH-48]|uniref:Uncharacterized protein n=1 Tax=Halostagnicola larsenii XH-48 TaxID=797299 RepID=W0JQR0_9EURY|nr:hypothetical protein [Halostagnicola larsenii]AHG01071.1 hypothetical protein HALLA_15355 [Halostagnicola larsenii XH-48]
MAYAHRSERLVPSSTWATLRDRTLELLLVVSLALGVASLTSLSTGNPESIAMIAGLSFVLIVGGLATIRLIEYLEANGVPALE